MESAWMILLVVLVAWNVIVFFLFGLDKKKAVAGEWRIPERVLLGCSAVFGALGGWLGMYVFHHKTRKAKFTITMPIFLFLQAAVLALIQRALLIP